MSGPEPLQRSETRGEAWESMAAGMSPFLMEGENWLAVSNIWIIFHFIYGMSSFPLTNSIIFQDGDIAPPTRKVLGPIGVGFWDVPGSCPEADL